MADNELFTKALAVGKPWYVKEVEFDISEKRLDIYIGRSSELLPCPICGNHVQITIHWKGNGDILTSSSTRHTYMQECPEQVAKNIESRR